MSTFGLLAMVALLPLFSSAPPAIHCSMQVRFSLGSIGDLGGMNGSSLWAIDAVQRRCRPGSPGLTTTPELLPSMSLV